MKPTIASLLLLSVLLSTALHASEGHSSKSGVELRLQQIDLDVALKQYAQLKMEFSRADFELALKGAAASEAEKSALEKKVQTLARRGDQAQRDIRGRSERINASLKATPSKTANIETLLQKIEMNVAIADYERVKMEASRVEIEQLLKATSASAADGNELARKSEMLARRAERLRKEIREHSGKIADAQKELESKAEAGTGREDVAARVAPANKPAPDTKAAEAEIAKAQQKLDALKSELDKRRKARSEATEDAAHDAAEKQVQQIKSEIEKTRAALEAAKAKLQKP